MAFGASFGKMSPPATDGSSGGSSVSIDAVTGGELGWFGWNAIP